MNPAPAAVAADRRRPRRTWYVVAALVAAGGVLAAAAVVFLVPFGGDLGQRVTPGQPVTVHLSEAERMVWARSSGPDVPDVRCEPSPADAREIDEWHTVSMLFDDLTLEADGERWRAVLKMAAGPTGTYTVTCTIPGGDGTMSLAIGDPPHFHGARSTALAVLAASVLVPLGVLVGVVLAVVVAVRRRRRLSSAGGSAR
ncbi:hypothetical protein [Micromonospora sp. NPDC049301]|uniref:hypothetical protein n=1 Tax=Micromonospora sp. NPDC049301 TaxID=3155723 RepID=UPI00342DD527